MLSKTAKEAKGVEQRKTHKNADDFITNQQIRVLMEE